jgi:hypothetical protein
MNLQENISRIKNVMGLISEQKTLSPELKKKVNQLITSEGNKVKQYYQQHYSKPETVAKFTKRSNVDQIKKYIPTIKFRVLSENGGRLGFVKKTEPGVINLNLNSLLIFGGNDVKQKDTLLYDTILHEMGHLIDFKMQDLGERTISSSSGYYNATDGKDNYVDSDVETFARIQRLREVLGLNPSADGNEIKRKLIDFIKSKKLVFPNVKISNVNSPTGLSFTTIETTKGRLSELWKFYSPIRINGADVPDISALFGKFSSYRNDGSIFLNLDLIGKVNVSTKAAPNSPETN